MTGPYSDAQLAAFLAGTLEDDALIDAIENAINADPALTERVEALALSADDPTAAVREAFAPVLGAPVPDRLAQIVSTSATPSTTAELVDFSTARSTPRLPQPANDTGGAWRWPQFAAMAASLAIGVLVGGPLLTGGNAGTADGALVLAGTDGTAPAPPLAAMLDAAPSGQSVELASLGTGEVVLTFRNIDGQLCRQFTLAAGAGTSDGLACAGADGGWQIEAFGRRAVETGELKLAGGDAAVSVVAAVDAMIDSDPLVGEDELAELKGK